MEPSPPINYLRMSVTDRCQLRCSYCTYWRKWRELPHQEILSYEELLKIAGVAAQVGIRKLRITGGEPLVRRGVVEFIRDLHQVPGLGKICLTTNGVLLRDIAPRLFAAGLRHLNLSLDTLRRHRYRRLTGGDHFREVWEGLEGALSLGFAPVKLNCVVLRGINDDELLNLALLARDHPFQVRFIELMPTISYHWWQRHFLPMTAVRRRLSVLGTPIPIIPDAAAGPARLVKLPGFRGELGFISPMTEHNCTMCNRLRLTPSGGLRPCLMQDAAIDLKKLLRLGASDQDLVSSLREAMRMKHKTSSHAPKLVGTLSPMAGVGG